MKCRFKPNFSIGGQFNYINDLTSFDKGQKKKEHVREKKNARQRDKKYWQVSREKKKEADEEGYLARNAERMRDYRSRQRSENLDVSAMTA